MGMRVFAIGDLHFDSKKEKPMDIFGNNWINHEEKIIRSWQKSVSDDDLVLIPGDISWAIKLEDAIKDLEIIDNLPGKKVLIRGNHDYWWATKNKLNNLKFKSIEFLVNDMYANDKVVVCGVRGWDDVRVFEPNILNTDAKKYDSVLDKACDCNFSNIKTDNIDYDIILDKEAISKNITYNNEEIKSQIDDKKIYNRELNRFEISLKMTKNYDLYKIAMLHFPPFNNDKSPNDFVSLMKEYNINKCIYGHLHGKDGHKLIMEGNIKGIDFVCVSSDYLDFQLKEIAL